MGKSCRVVRPRVDSLSYPFFTQLDPQLTQRGMGLDRLAKRMNLESMATGPNQP